ncbi:phosphoadenylyl-sulfate reductase [Marinicella meishanensis]|uniref:phosphoadenylyl-sulfate reductase n=1 Tax=Marinicella meishanensis TaxID=2873263 RepID=UPI001CBB4CFC|nr:phosphoadenylyl-sulfate reductase [Marinicella sp. NBU2979]
MNHSCHDLHRQTPPAYHCMDHMNRDFAALTTTQRVEQAAQYLPGHWAMTSSFGIDAAVSLHLINSVIPGIPVILIDTGYLFPETYQYAELLTDRLGLNLQVHQSPVSAARFESQHGPLWEAGLPGLERYNQLRKVEPLQQALAAGHIGSWFAGVRRSQSAHRQQLPWIEFKQDRYKIHPLLDWTDRDMYQYLQQQRLPQHPLFDQGYLTVGDTHSTKSLHEVDELDQLRFFGLKRECGIHE